MIRKRLSPRKSWPFAVLVMLCAAVLAGVLTGTTRPLSAAQFAQTGHWVYNSLLQTVFHVDGGTTYIDAHLPMQADPGSQVVQGETDGYVVGPSRITVFDKAALAIKQIITPPAAEVPLGIEVVGGPYLVYRDAGKVVRLGDPTATMSAGGPVGVPVVTEDGTMWLHRTEIGSICKLPKDAGDITDCPVSAPRGHPGAMTIVDGRPAFVDLFAGTIHIIDGGALGQGIPLGVQVSPNSRPAAQDLAGRVAILDPQRPGLVLVDIRTPGAKPVPVALPPGEYDGPVSTGDVIALVNRQTGAVVTYGPDGVRKDEKPIKQKTGTPRLSRGEDKRVYVEDAEGTQVLVVARDGNVQDVTVTGKQATTTVQVPPPAAPETQTDVRAGQPAGPPPGPRNPGPGRQTQRPPAPDRPVRNTTPPPVPASRPGAPPSVAAQAGNGTATVTWGAAADNRAAVTSYRVTWQGGSTTVGGGARRAAISGLTNGVRYVFTVTATNRVGAGPGAASNAVTPVAPASPPGAPVNLDADYDVDDRPTRDVTLTWRRPALNGGTLLHYIVTATGEGTRQVTGTSVKYPQVHHTRVITFTVRAVTRSPDGQTLTGPATTATHTDR